MRYTPEQFMNIMRVIYCWSFDEFASAMGYDGVLVDSGSGRYVLEKFEMARKNLFGFLAELDSNSLDRITTEAFNKVQK